MPKCNLSIEIEDGDRIYHGDEVVRGVVVVRTDEAVRCKGLDVHTNWSTHGRGNVDSGQAAMKTVFEGEWAAGQEYRYPFELPCAKWPPTYHGSYMNVDHYVTATARIPWAFDPKASKPFRVITFVEPGSTPVVTNMKAGEGCGAVGGTIGVMIIAVVALMFLLNPFFWILGLLGLIIFGIHRFFFRYLPKKRLGQVEYRLERLQWGPGETLRGEFVVHPQRDISINEIAWHVTATEQCVSGSGSNKKTHTNEMIKKEKSFFQSQTLPGNQETRIPLELPLPEKPIYSMDLGDNKLSWTSTLRVDIPRWPDWTSKVDFQVVPLRLDSGEFSSVSTSDLEPTFGDVLPAEPVEEPGITFAETVDMIWANREQPDQIERLVEAVIDLPMRIDAIIERRELYGGNAHPRAYDGGHVVLARAENLPLPLSLFVPPSHGGDFERSSGGIWSGRGMIVGYDPRHGRLLVRVEY